MSGNNSTTSSKVLVNLFFKWPYTRNEINDHILYQVFTHYGVLHIKHYQNTISLSSIMHKAKVSFHFSVAFV